MKAFESYTWQHLLPIVCFALIAIVAIRFANQRPFKTQVQLGTAMAVVVLATMVAGSILKLIQGTYSLQEDLPLYVCRTIAWMLPFVIVKVNRFWLRIFYFWILAGTLQGIVTPDLIEGFPSFPYFRYWFLHAGLVVVILYAVIVFQIRVTWRDFGMAVLLAQGYLVISHVANLLLESNYSYTMRKPPGPSVVDLFGPWPWYILGGEAVMLTLYLLLMLPWIVRKRQVATA